MLSKISILEKIGKNCKAVTYVTKYHGQYGQDKEQIASKYFKMYFVQVSEGNLGDQCLSHAMCFASGQYNYSGDKVTFLITSLLKAVLAINGIDTNQYKAHSPRAVAVSAFPCYLPV